jgi:esterase/lipase superfamily enzyme
MHRIAFAIALLVSIVASSPGPLRAQTGPGAAGDRWVRIGELTLDRLATRDALDLDETSSGKFKAIRLEAKRADVVVTRVQVLWYGVPLFTEDRTINLRAGERTRPIGTRNEPRALARVGIVYQAPPGQKGVLPVIEVWGLESAPPAAPAAVASGDGVLLASQNIGFAADRAVIPAASNAGSFARIGLRLQQNDIFVNEVRVVFSDGEAATLTVGRNLSVGSPPQWFDLKGEKSISQLELAYKSRPGFKGQAHLEIYGSASADDPAKARVAIDMDMATRGIPGGETPTRVATRMSEGPALALEGSPCITSTVCTPVAVFFGTNRERKDEGGRIQFTQNRGEAPILGQATVTVPRAYRKKGEIPRPSWWDLARLANPYKEDPARHFTILDGATKVYAGADEFIAAVKAAMAEAGSFKDHAFVFVHGYNVSFENALYRTAQIAYDLGQDDLPFGTAFLYSWPSAGELESYIYDLESAEKAAPHLEAFIDLVVARSGAKHVHLIAHSMGNAPLLAALSNIAARRGSAPATINQVILAAPDVDAKDFAELSARILPIATTLTLYASSQDRAIQASRMVRRDLPRAGDVVNGLPVMVPGLDTIDVSTVSTSILSLNHTAYADKKELLNDMRRLMLTGERPPDVRDISIRKVTEPVGTFWRFTK